MCKGVETVLNICKINANQRSASVTNKKNKF